MNQANKGFQMVSIGLKKKTYNKVPRKVL